MARVVEPRRRRRGHALHVSEEVEEAEKLRDPTHVRNYTEAEWRELLESAGLEVERASCLRAARIELRRRGSRAPAARATTPSACASCSRRTRPTTARPGTTRAHRRQGAEVAELMAIIVDNDTKLVVSGLTGSRGPLPRAAQPRLRHERRRRRHARQGRPGRRGHPGLRHGRRRRRARPARTRR